MRTECLSDTDLIRQFVNQHDNTAFEALLERYRKKVYTYIYLMVKRREVADDVFQETFIKVVHSLKEGKYEDSGKFLPWVSRIAHNKVIDYFRNQHQSNECCGDNGEWSAVAGNDFSDLNAEDKAVHIQIRKDVRQMLDYLPADQREIVVMRHYMEMSFKEIAEQLNVSLNTALGRMRYAVLNLRKMVETNKITLEI
ncbi:MAG: sigma-70 family RNA polymerase sigma factor [Prevotellaceae bacterium]|jgi:RNA polymerase sigma-70 factor (ECF subfamily)|nr:sigma-70 family RNA polymerase sigma factor [Prevotellaceae bacterium]